MRFRSAAHSTSVAFLLLASLFVAGCSSSDEHGLPLRPAEILAFEASPATLAPGDPTRITWQTRWAVGVRLFAGAEELELGDQVAEEGDLEFFPAANTDLTLEAEGEDGVVVRAKATVRVEAAGELEIRRFKAEPAEIARGEASTLSWEVMGRRGARAWRPASSASSGCRPAAAPWRTRPSCRSR